MTRPQREAATPEAIIADILRSGVEIGKAGKRSTKALHDNAYWCGVELMKRLGEVGTASMMYDRIHAETQKGEAI